jgi:hypothetical protein
MLTFYVGASNVVELSGLTNAVTGAVDNAATVTVTVKDSTGASNILGDTFPKAMSYVAASSGKYRATVSANLAIVAGTKYRAIVDVTGSAGDKDRREIPIMAAYRQET